MSFAQDFWVWLQDQGPKLITDLIVFVLILLVGRVVIGAVCRVTRRALERADRVSALLRKFAIDTLRKVLWVVVLMLALPRVGVDVAPLIAGLGVAGFVIGFAFQESLGNLAAGVMILLNQPFKNGDYVEAGGHAGSVKELNLMATTLTSPDNRKIIIPNKAVWGGSIVNYTTLGTRRVDLKFGIGYRSDMSKARSILTRLLETNDKVLKEPAYTVEVVELADSSVNFVVRPWCNTGDYWALYFELTRAVKEEFDREGIEIPFPQMDVHVRNAAA
ncbi:MAG TPA: mechanosensitive ion channel domain-containing protein [candidate division Zixibacteria bacterium]|nr:mechanosensitive ion channel domain-containing protein [candidate division Zixibacteria bacterium]